MNHVVADVRRRTLGRVNANAKSASPYVDGYPPGPVHRPRARPPDVETSHEPVIRTVKRTRPPFVVVVVIAIVIERLARVDRL
jgi:hypothetical protein